MNMAERSLQSKRSKKKKKLQRRVVCDVIRMRPSHRKIAAGSKNGDISIGDPLCPT